MDWFAVADQPVEQVRAALHVTPKSEAARRAGSIGPWEPGGISEYQHATAIRAAEEAGRPYEPYGASP